MSDSTLQLTVKRADFDYLAARAIISSETVAAVWEALLEMQDEDNMRNKQGASRVSCRRVAIVGGMGLVGLGLVAGCVLTAAVASPLAGPPFALVLVALCETLGWLLRTRKIARNSETEEGAQMWAGVSFCVSVLVGMPLLYTAIGWATFPESLAIYYQVWGYVLIAMLPATAHFIFSKTRPLASLALYVHGYVLLFLIMTTFARSVHSVAMGAIPPLLLALSYIGLGLFFDYRVRLESFAAFAHGAGLLGLVAALCVMLWDARVWPVAVYPVIVVLLALCGWLVGRRIFFVASAVLTLAWLVAAAALVRFTQTSILVLPAVLVGVGGVVVAVCLLLAKYHLAIERALHDRLPAWMFTEAARRHRANEITRGTSAAVVELESL